jgi:dienelactone hydrolase
MRAFVAATMGALCLATPAVLRAARPTVVRLAVTPPTARLDEPVVVRVSGLRPDQDVVVRSSTPDADGREWNAEASFRADAKGVVDLSTQAAASGSYIGVDAMGLFWSARPATPLVPSPPPEEQAAMERLRQPPTALAFPRPVSGTLETRLEAVVDGKAVAATTLARQITTVEINVTEVREDGLVGRLYEPSGTRHPAVLVLSGSNGGIPPTYASVLAGRGYVTFALAYFRAEGLPKDLVEIPLEYFRSGIEWLRARPSVDPERIAVLGISKGGELSLLLGATWPQVKAVIALSPSSVVWEGAVRDPAKSGLDALRPGRSSWSLDGKPLPFLPKVASLDQPEAAAATIPVEKIRGPVLLVSSRDDGMWPATVMSDRVVERLRASGFAHPVEHLHYESCAHGLPDAWLPPSYGGKLGGTAEGTMRAYGDYWPKVRAFLDRAIGPPIARKR